ncbi:hypothetical protein [Culicoidibacter larvae]|uniref:YtxH domain-containing protein n=1 Tax=Culicoidibacter larvae TaxID=2579976 RepID=A0A5R8Q7Q0_9FIRM|nr:hypothetical protein [Culicoidibacter larvae]TLG71077.1 hypothetical protein FEZ08_11745 [Culicoidibacter larvae]
MRKFKFICIGLLLGIMISVNIATPVSANDTGQNCNEVQCEPSDYEESPVGERPQDTEALDFFTAAIVSKSKEVYEQFEKTTMYAKNFMATAFGVPKYDATWSGDIGGILLFIVSLIVMILQMIGSLIAYLVWFFETLVAGSFIKDIVMSVQSYVNITVFEWDKGMNSFGAVILTIIAIALIASYVMKGMNKLTPINVLKFIGSTVFSCVLVGVIAFNMTDIDKAIENVTADFFSVVVFNGDDTTGEVPLEVQDKTSSYELLFLQPWLIQNFEVGSIAELDIILARDPALYNNMTAQELVNKILPCSFLARDKQNTCYEQTTNMTASEFKTKQYFQILNSEHQVTYVTGLAKSLLLFVHKISIAIPVFLLSAIRGVFELIRWLTLVFIFPALIMQIVFKKKYATFILNRFLWHLFAWGIATLCVVIKHVYVELLAQAIANTHFLAILVVDALLLAALVLAWHFREQLMQWLGKVLKAVGSMMVSSIIDPDYSPLDFMKSAASGLNEAGMATFGKLGHAMANPGGSGNSKNDDTNNDPDDDDPKDNKKKPLGSTPNSSAAGDQPEEDENKLAPTSDKQNPENDIDPLVSDVQNIPLTDSNMNASGDAGITHDNPTVDDSSSGELPPRTTYSESTDDAGIVYRYKAQEPEEQVNKAQSEVDRAVSDHDS